MFRLYVYFAVLVVGWSILVCFCLVCFFLPGLFLSVTYPARGSNCQADAEGGMV